MRRELLEEYGVVPLDITLLGHFELFRTLANGTPTHWIAIAHVVKVDPKKVQIMEPDMVEESGWFSLDALPSPLHSSIESVLLPQFGQKISTIITKKEKSKLI